MSKSQYLSVWQSLRKLFYSRPTFLALPKMILDRFGLIEAYGVSEPVIVKCRRHDVCRCRWNLERLGFFRRPWTWFIVALVFFAVNGIRRSAAITGAASAVYTNVVIAAPAWTKIMQAPDMFLRHIVHNLCFFNGKKSDRLVKLRKSK